MFGAIWLFVSGVLSDVTSLKHLPVRFSKTVLSTKFYLVRTNESKLTVSGRSYIQLEMRERKSEGMRVQTNGRDSMKDSDIL